MRDFKVIGLMSGSSLDGVDIAYVNFSHDNKKWFFQVVEAGNIPYSEEWKIKLSNAFHSNVSELKKLDIEYGKYLGDITKKFIEKYELEPKLIASHGHTIFHIPEKSYTLQIGNGQEIADITGVVTINDFRTEDVSKGGQGAPLVPIGDKYLFADFPICLNIGGIANISYDIDNQRIAYDICMANQILNYLANKLGYDYYDQELTGDYLYNKIHSKRLPIKTVLLDQSIITGIGNIYADEILFASKINPRSYASDVSKKECNLIVKNTKIVLEKAVKLGGTTIKSFTSSEGVHGLFQNELLVHRQVGKKCPNCNEIILKIKVGGRGTYYCPKCQK